MARRVDSRRLARAGDRWRHPARDDLVGSDPPRAGTATPIRRPAADPPRPAAATPIRRPVPGGASRARHERLIGHDGNGAWTQVTRLGVALRRVHTGGVELMEWALAADLLT